TSMRDGNLVAPWHVRVVHERVDPQRGAVPDGIVAVEGGAAIGVAAGADGGAREAFQARLLRHQVYRSSRRSSSEVGGGGPLDDLDLLECENVPGLGACIANAVDEHVRACVE